METCEAYDVAGLEHANVKISNTPVNHPSHYNQGKYEVIDVIDDWQLGFCAGNAVKYIARAGHKDPNKTVEDYEKAVWYLNHLIASIKGKKKYDNDV